MTILYNANATDVVANATDTYLTGSSVDITNRLKIGSLIRWTLAATKTATGTAVPQYNIRFGTGATVTDTARVTLTGVAQTAATDNAFFDVVAVIRATGATTVAAGALLMHHTNGVSGFRTDETPEVKSGLSTGFDATPATTKVGLSFNPGAAGVWTFPIVQVQVENIV